MIRPQSSKGCRLKQWFCSGGYLFLGLILFGCGDRPAFGTERADGGTPNSTATDSVGSDASVATEQEDADPSLDAGNVGNATEVSDPSDAGAVATTSEDTGAASTGSNLPSDEGDHSSSEPDSGMESESRGRDTTGNDTDNSDTVTNGSDTGDASFPNETDLSTDETGGTAQPACAPAIFGQAKFGAACFQ